MSFFGEQKKKFGGSRQEEEEEEEDDVDDYGIATSNSTNELDVNLDDQNFSHHQDYDEVFMLTKFQRHCMQNPLLCLNLIVQETPNVDESPANPSHESPRAAVKICI